MLSTVDEGCQESYIVLYHISGHVFTVIMTANDAIYRQRMIDLRIHNATNSTGILKRVVEESRKAMGWFKDSHDTLVEKSMECI